MTSTSTISATDVSRHLLNQQRKGDVNRLALLPPISDMSRLTTWGGPTRWPGATHVVPGCGGGGGGGLLHLLLLQAGGVAKHHRTDHVLHSVVGPATEQDPLRPAAALRAQLCRQNGAQRSAGCRTRGHLGAGMVDRVPVRCNVKTQGGRRYAVCTVNRERVQSTGYSQQNTYYIVRRMQSEIEGYSKQSTASRVYSPYGTVGVVYIHTVIHNTSTIDFIEVHCFYSHSAR